MKNWFRALKKNIIGVGDEFTELMSILMKILDENQNDINRH